MQTALLDKGDAINSVERIFEIDFQNNFVRVVRITMKPLPEGVDSNFGAHWHGNTNLQWEEQGGGLLLGGFAKRVSC